ncbi:MAG TPA: type II toxin-antitoxin system RelE/ParE family toxin [Candidatus Dormibacteraeota bacterium]|nr:type II toxin-antitoxin system RelE/ParE family toxin [Candidatus Dormibacteraeota bacterium]
MAIRFELVADAVSDLEALVASGNIRLFLVKLVRLEGVGKDAGQPLGNQLTGLRKIVVGDRNGRIIFKMNTEDTVATVWVIGDRNDSECYEDAVRRLKEAGDSQPDASGLASVVLSVMGRRFARRKRSGKNGGR